MREGSLQAPVRHPLNWQDPAFYDEAALDAEMRRVFDICHGCRRCFNLCDSFPRLFDLVDAAGDAELAGVPSEAFAAVVDGCTLCDLCFMTKCPYVPPHAFNLDFPHLMLRWRVVARRNRGVPFAHRQLTETDRNGRLAGAIAGLVNWASDERNCLTRPVMEKVAGVHQQARLPAFHNETLVRHAKNTPYPPNAEAPARGRKVVLFATCFANYNNPSIGKAALAVLARNGVEVNVVYPGCCGMPQLEQGDVEKVNANAALICGQLAPWVEKGYAVVALVPSCALMLKSEWRLIVPADAPHRPQVDQVAAATFDISEYIVDIARKEGLAPGLEPLEGGVTVHIACHARAQNIGPKAAEMLRLIPETRVQMIERCSGHGGSWGILKENFETALAVGKPVAKQAARNNARHVASECPLAGAHIIQGMERLEGPAVAAPAEAAHPIELMARAYGLL